MLPFMESADRTKTASQMHTGLNVNEDYEVRFLIHVGGYRDMVLQSVRSCSVGEGFEVHAKRRGGPNDAPLAPASTRGSPITDSTRTVAERSYTLVLRDVLPQRPFSLPLVCPRLH